MAINTDEYMYRMQEMMRHKEREMEEKFRYMQQMLPPSHLYQQGFEPQQKQKDAVAKKPAFQNPKLLLTKGS